jgi:hypothetical protein
VDLHASRGKSYFVLVTLLLCLSGIVQAQAIRPAKPIQAKAPPSPVTRRTTQLRRNLIRHNEAGAIMTLRTLLSAEATYQATTGNGNYGTIEELRREKLIDFVLAEGHRYGYLFRITHEKFSSESPASYEIVAVPRTYGQTGQRSFYMDETGVLRFADKHGAEANHKDDLVVIDP